MDYKDLFKLAEEIEDLTRKGYDKATLSKNFKGFSDQAFSIAKARIKNARDNKINQDFLFDEDDLRFCTNQKIAEYRAERLKCATIVDIGSGIGVQAVEFAKKCGKVIAIEIDKRKVEFSKINAEIAGVNNIEFVNDDALITLSKLKGADIVFWDPERPPTEAERGLDSFVPKFDVLIKKAGLLSENIVVELPPQIDRSKVKGCEFEYISLNNQLNRLNIYFGKLKKCNISVVSLPSGERLEYNKERFDKPFRSKVVKKFLYELDNGLVKSGISDFFISKLENAFLFEWGNKSYLTSDTLLKSGFLKGYSVVSYVELKDLNKFLLKNNFGRIVLHGKIDDKKYFSLKAGFEKGLKGEGVAHVFLDQGQAVVAIVG